MLEEAPDQRAPTKYHWAWFWLQNRPGNPIVSDTRWLGLLIPLFLCDLTYHLAKTGADTRAPPGMLLEVIPTNVGVSHIQTIRMNSFSKLGDFLIPRVFHGICYISRSWLQKAANSVTKLLKLTALFKTNGFSFISWHRHFTFRKS